MEQEVSNESPEAAGLALTVLGSGSKGNATVVRCGDWTFLIDAGFSNRELRRRLELVGIDPAEIRGVLVTHEHIDHVRGLATFSEKVGCGVWANALTAMQLREHGRVRGPVTVFANAAPFEVGPVRVEAISVSHDAVDPVGFVLSVGETRAAVVTDLGWSGKMVPLKIRNASMLVIESNHCPQLLRASPRPARLQQRIHGRRGHLSNACAAALLTEVVGPATRHVVLAHLSEDCNRPELAHETATGALRAMGREDVEVIVASQHEASATIRAW